MHDLDTTVFLPGNSDYLAPFSYEDGTEMFRLAYRLHCTVFLSGIK